MGKKDIKKINGTFKGSISVNDMNFCEFYTREVKSANKKGSSGQIYLPQHLINKKVIILLPEDDE